MPSVVTQPIARKRFHCLLFFADAVADNVEAFSSKEVGPVIDLCKDPNRCAWTKRDLAFRWLVLAAQHFEEMRFACSVRANEANAFAVVDLFGEWHEQVVDGNALEFGNTAGCICATQANINLLVGNWRRRRAGCNKLFPTGFGAVGFCCILEVLSRSLFHDFHVVEEAPLFIIPTLQVVTK